MITNRFSAARPISAAQGRHGEMIVVQGNGVRPVRWTGDGAGVDAGMDPPSVQPQITLDSTLRYYIARVDIHKPGACYYSPPDVTFTSSVSPASLGGRVAKAKAYLSQSAVSEAVVDDGGKYYPEPPPVSLSDSHGKVADHSGASVPGRVARG
jgi:hypothetical protein